MQNRRPADVIQDGILYINQGVTPRFATQRGYISRAKRRNSNFWIFPVDVFGNS
jgi:hypothetical protein